MMIDLEKFATFVRISSFNLPKESLLKFVMAYQEYFENRLRLLT